MENGEMPAEAYKPLRPAESPQRLDNPLNVIPESQSRENYAIFFSGGLGTDRGLIGYKKSLQDLYGENNVSVFNSMLSPDKPNPQRFNQMAEQIMRNVEEGQSLTLIAHSLGAAELTAALKIIESKNQDFLRRPENLNKLNITLIAPSGLFEGASGARQFIKNVAQFATAGLEIGGKTRSYNYTVGIDSTTLIPPSTVTQENLIQSIRDTFPELSQMREGLSAINFTPVRDYSPRLGTLEREQLNQIDLDLKIAIESKDKEKIKRVLHSRGKLLQTHLGNAYNDQGEPGQEKSDTPKSKEKSQRIEMLKLYGGALLGLRSLLADTFRGEPLKMMNEIRSRGVKIGFLVPEYDVVMPIENIAKFYNLPTNELTTEVTILSLFSHASMGYQPEALSRALAPTIRQEVENTINNALQA